MNDQVNAFIKSMEIEPNPLFTRMEDYAAANFVPIIKPQARKLLQSLVWTKQPTELLEVGTAIGYSALTLVERLPNVVVTTLERNKEMVALAREHFLAAGELSKNITLIEGEALQFLETIQGPTYDFIFLDSAKAQYITFLPYLLKGLKVGGCLVTDNVLQAGTITKSRYAIERRNRTIHQRMREYLYTITHHPLLDTVILPIDDGMAISVKKQEE